MEGFGNLELTDVQEAGPPMLQPGTHIVCAKEARIEDVQGTSNKKLVVVFEAVDGSGQLIESFNIHHTNQQATEIGLKQLKSFLVPGPAPEPRTSGGGGHDQRPEGRHPRGHGQALKGREGRIRETPEIRRFYDMEKPIPFRSRPAAQQANQGSTRSILNDEIPF